MTRAKGPALNRRLRFQSVSTPSSGALGSGALGPGAQVRVVAGRKIVRKGGSRYRRLSRPRCPFRTLVTTKKDEVWRKSKQVLGSLAS